MSADAGTEAPAPPVARSTARLAGLLYLGTIATGIFAEAFVRGGVAIRGDGAATARAIALNDGLYRAGAAADILMLCCYVAVTMLLYELLGGAGRQLSRIAAAFSLVGIAVLAVDTLLHLAPLALLHGGWTPQLPLPQRDALIGLALDLHGDAYGVSLIFFGIYCALIGWLALRSAMLPRLVGWLMIVGGLSHVFARFAAILSPGLSASLPGAINLAPLIGEAALALWLILFGLRARPGPRAVA